MGNHRWPNAVIYSDLGTWKNKVVIRDPMTFILFKERLEEKCVHEMERQSTFE